MAHLKRSFAIGLWFMFLTLPLVVVRVNTISREVEWRWANLLWVGGGAFAIAWFWQFSINRRVAASCADARTIRRWPPAGHR